MSCGSSDSQSSSTGEFADEATFGEDGKADNSGSPVPVGSYGVDASSSTSLQQGDISYLILRTDKKYLLGIATYCNDGPCDSKDYAGTYEFTKSRGVRYIRMRDAQGAIVARYAFELKLKDGGTTVQDSAYLNIRKPSAKEWQGLTLSYFEHGLCKDVSDCGMQNNRHPDAPGEWKCTWECTYWAQTAAGNGCETAGGTCMPINDPYQDCATALDNQNWFTGVPELGYNCGDGLELRCCVPDGKCLPKCQKQGTEDEGWYNPCTGYEICTAKCGDATPPTCGEPGTKVEGWYVENEAWGCSDWDRRGGGKLFVNKAKCAQL